MAFVGLPEMCALQAPDWEICGTAGSRPVMMATFAVASSSASACCFCWRRAASASSVSFASTTGTRYCRVTGVHRIDACSTPLTRTTGNRSDNSLSKLVGIRHPVHLNIARGISHGYP